MRSHMPRGRRLLLAAATAALSLAPAAPALAEHNGDTHTDNIRVTGHAPFPYASDLAFRGNTAVAGSGDWDGAHPTGIRLFNVANPSNPQQLSFARCDGWHTDVDFVGNRYAVQSYDSDGPEEGEEGACSPGEGKQGVRVFDVSNRNQPESIGFAETIHGSHNLTAVGDTGLVYVASYNLRNPADVDGVSIVDVAADPKDPPITFLEFPDADSRSGHQDMKNESGKVPASIGCHDIGLDLERDRAFCAGITETHIWDISNPREPVIEQIIYNPAISIHHGAQASADGDTLILQDEWLGAAGYNSGCLAPSQPSGGLWFYDISDPKDPTLVGEWSSPDPAPTDDFCTTHFFDTFDDRDWVVTSYYDNGLYVVDFSDPGSPEVVARYDPEGATFWSAYAHRGALYATSFAPATFFGNDESNLDKGGLWVFELDGYSRSDK